MPRRKSAQSLIELCWERVFRKFDKISRQAESLAPSLLNELVERCYECLKEHYRFPRMGYLGYKLPSELFIRPETEELYSLSIFDLPEDEVLEKICNTCKGLQKVQLEFNFVEITHYSPNLTYLELNCSDVIDDDLPIITHHCPQLKNLLLIECWEITDEGMQYLPPQLSYLDVLRTNITEKGCVDAIKALQSLQELEHKKWKAILKLLSQENHPKTYSIENLPIIIKNQTDFDFCNVALDLFPNLRDIKIYCNFKLKVNIAAMIRNVNPKVTTLCLCKMSVNSIGIIGYLCPMLEELNITFYKRGIETHFVIPEDNVSFKHLRKLKIDAENLDVPVTNLLPMLENCHELEELKITYYKYSNQLISEAIVVNPLHHVKYLSLCNCHFLTIEFMISLLDSLISLNRLKISYCNKIRGEEKRILKKHIRSNNWNVSVNII